MESISRDRAEALVERHLQLFNEPDRAKREQGMAEIYTADLRFTDYHHQSVGYGGYGDVADTLQARLPGFTIRAAGPMDLQFDYARFGWILTSAAAPPIHGIDILRFRDGLIAEIVIFLDPPPA